MPPHKGSIPLISTRFLTFAPLAPICRTRWRRIASCGEGSETRIDEAIAEIKRAAIDDGKDLHDHPPVDARMAWPGRLHRAKELLEKAHQDIAHEEDNAFAQGLQ